MYYMCDNRHVLILFIAKSENQLKKKENQMHKNTIFNDLVKKKYTNKTQ